MRVFEHKLTEEEFIELLEEASNQASNDWEHEFVRGIQYRFDTYGMNGYLSAKQLAVLNRIVVPEGEEVPAVDEVMERQYNKGGNYYFDPFNGK